MAASSMRRVVVPCSAAASRFLARKSGGAFVAATRKAKAPECTPGVDVFLSHRGVDTKSSVAGLLYERLVQMNIRPFLDNRSMEPGDKLYECINAGIRQSKVGVAIFSPRYCDSVFCLHELAMMVEANKKLIPVFCDVKPSDLVVCGDPSTHSPEDLRRYNRAITEAKRTVGLNFDSKNGNWSELVSRTVNIVLKCLEEERYRQDVYGVSVRMSH
ncbi:putative 2' cyclic ADP-D-ribose synthase BdTIR [Curcuma longa]|uniref:putative 2' cyclic ADP-D-ribose synthase BdTIR n=1 Tax=Curcuma longa TaxID=136217 RepID=UPI003D9E9367